MPNGGPKPDCAHCRHITEPLRGAQCQLHNFEFHMPLYLFCADWASAYPEGEDELWDELGSLGEQIKPNTMYVWLETHFRDNDNNPAGARFDPARFADIATFRELSEEEFWNKTLELQAKLHDFYRQQGKIVK